MNEREVVESRIEQPSMCPDECPVLAVSDVGKAKPCSLMRIQTGAAHIPTITQCTRCGWVDPAQLDASAYAYYLEAMTGMEQRIALATGVEPFAFVEQTGTLLSLREAVVQALAAASLAWDPQPTGQIRAERAQQIGVQLTRFIYETFNEELENERNRAR